MISCWSTSSARYDLDMEATAPGLCACSTPELLVAVAFELDAVSWGASLSRRSAAAAALFASWPPFAISSKKRRCKADMALALALALASSSDLRVPVGGTLAARACDSISPAGVAD